MDIARLRTLASHGISRPAMAEEFGVSLDSLNRILRKHGIRTCARYAGKPKPVKQPRLFLGIGQPPAKLMPTADAVRCASIWGLAGHAPTVFRSPV